MVLLEFVHKIMQNLKYVDDTFLVISDDMGRVSGRVLRERANMSFCIVIIFFAVFFIIVLTEIFLIDQNSRNRNRRQHARTRSNYEDAVIISRVNNFQYIFSFLCLGFVPA